MKTILSALVVGVMTLVCVQAQDQSSSISPATTPLFDGKTFDGWEGSIGTIWRIEDGALVGSSLQGLKRNEFLSTTKSFSNFVLRLEFKLTGVAGFINSGVQIRSQRREHEMVGYQMDIGDPAWWGSIYDEARRNRVLAQSNTEAVNTVIRRNDWNQYVIHADGPRIRGYINGLMTIDYTEPDASIPQAGHFGLQVHAGGRTEVWFRNIHIQELP